MIGLSSVINSIKIFSYRINENFDDAYSFPYTIENECDKSLNICIPNIIYILFINIVSNIPIIIIDFKLLRKIKERNIVKLIYASNKDKTMLESKKREEKITIMIILNTIFFIILRSPEIYFSFFIISRMNNFLKSDRMIEFFKWKICDFIQCDNLEIFDFILPLNGPFQFLLFCICNKKFRLAAKNLIK